MIKMINVDSSNIKAIGFENNILKIAFVGGGLYEYSDVPNDVFNQLLTSDSKGKFFAREIRNKYKYFEVKEDQPVPDKPRTIEITDLLSKRIQDGKYDYAHDEKQGIRSRQIVALIDLLVEKGIL